MRRIVVVKNWKFVRDLGGGEVNVEVVSTCDLIQTEFVLTLSLLMYDWWFVAE